MYPAGWKGSGNVVFLCASAASNTTANSSETISRVKLPFPARIVDCFVQTDTTTASGTAAAIKVWPAVQTAAGAHVMSASSLAVTITTTAIQAARFGELSAAVYPENYCVALKQIGSGTTTGKTMGITQFFVAVEPMLKAD